MKIVLGKIVSFLALVLFLNACSSSTPLIKPLPTIQPVQITSTWTVSPPSTPMVEASKTPTVKPSAAMTVISSDLFTMPIPQVSPGSYIVYYRYSQFEKGKDGVYLLSLDGKQEYFLFPTIGSYGDIAISYDHTKVIYYDKLNSGSQGLYVLDVSFRDINHISGTDKCANPSFLSKSSSEFVALCEGDDPTYRYWYLYYFNISSREKILIPTIDNTHSIREPIISQNGNLLAFTTYSSNLPRYEGGLFILDLDCLKNITSCPSKLAGPYQVSSKDRGYSASSWSPDNKEILVCGTDGNLFVYNLGSYSVRLISDQCENAVWSPDGKKIAFTKDDDAYLVSAQGGSPTLLRVFTSVLGWVNITQDDVWLSPAKPLPTPTLTATVNPMQK